MQDHIVDQTAVHGIHGHLVFTLEKLKSFGCIICYRDSLRRSTVLTYTSVTFQISVHFEHVEDSRKGKSEKKKGHIKVLIFYLIIYNKTCLKRPLKNRQNKDLNDKWLPNESRK